MENEKGDAAQDDPSREETMSESLVDLYGRRSRTLYAQDQYDKAIVDLREALRLAPENHFALLWIFRGLADCYFCKAEWDTAIDYYSRCIDRAPTDAYARRWRANAYVQKGDKQKALADLEELLRIAPDDAESYMMIAHVHCTLGNHEREIDAYTQAIRLAPNNPFTLSKRGDAYTRAGKYELAIKDHNRAIELALLKAPPTRIANGQASENN